MKRPRRIRWTAGLAILTAGLALQPAPARAQDSVSGLAAECGGQSAALEAWCTEVGLAFQAAQGGLGRLSTGGSVLPGSAGSLGWRLESVPRFSAAGRLQVGRLTLPDVVAEPRTPAPERTSTVTTAQLTAGVGVFDGFSPLPTVGGVLAVDLLASGSVALLPGGDGFRDDARTWGVGGRLGLLRESFTLPGVSVSAVRRWSGRTQLGSVDDGGPAEIDFDLGTTSLRATVGKDLLGVGVVAGVGWDRYESDVTLRARTEPPGGGPVLQGIASADGFETSRTLVFGGASLNFLILQISAEGGWARGYERLPGRAAGGYDPGASTPFGSLAFRLTL